MDLVPLDCDDASYFRMYGQFGLVLANAYFYSECNIYTMGIPPVREDNRRAFKGGQQWYTGRDHTEFRG